MVKISTIFGLGVLVALTPFLGFPIGGKNFIYIVSGILIVVLSVLIRRELHEVLRHLHTENVSTGTFVDSKPAETESTQ